MGIYNRDNVNYGGFLQNAIANKIHNAERQAEHEKAMAKLWGDTIAKAGQTIGRGAFYSYGGDNASSVADTTTSAINTTPTTVDEDKAELNYWEGVREQKAADAPKGLTLQEQAAQAMFGYNPTNQSDAASHFMDNYRPNTFSDRVLTNQNNEEEQIRQMLERYERNKYNPYLQNLWRA